MNNGVVISIEGIDGAGKNSQSNQIKEYLKNKNIDSEIISFPQYNTTIGKVIAKYLKGEYGDISSVPFELICIAYAADRMSITEHINDNKKNGIWTILDRFTYSNLFTAAKLPEEQWNTFISWVEDMEFNNLGVVKPDYNFYLYIDPMVSVKRIEERGKRDYQDNKEDIHENNTKLLIDTAKCYLQFAENKEDWFIINQMENEQQISPKDVFAKIKTHLDFILNNR